LADDFEKHLAGTLPFLHTRRDGPLHGCLCLNLRSRVSREIERQGGGGEKRGLYGVRAASTLSQRNLSSPHKPHTNNKKKTRKKKEGISGRKRKNRQSLLAGLLHFIKRSRGGGITSSPILLLGSAGKLRGTCWHEGVMPRRKRSRGLLPAEHDLPQKIVGPLSAEEKENSKYAVRGEESRSFPPTRRGGPSGQKRKKKKKEKR